MPSPTLTDLDYTATKTYDDKEVCDETDLDTTYTAFQTFVNTSLKANLQQLARDCFGIVDYQFDSDGAAQYTNNLFDKQYITDFYNGGDIAIGVVADAAWGAVDAVNAAVTITPEKVGAYRATFYFTHRVTSTATTEFTADVGFRITDGTDASYAVNSGGRIPATAGGSGEFYNPVFLTCVFDWATTTAKTVTLQNYNRTLTDVSANVVAAAAATGEIYMIVEKI